MSDKQDSELARLPVGTRVKIRRCGGLGVGIVRRLITSRVVADSRGVESVIPLRGWVEAEVELEGLDEGRAYTYVDRFPTSHLVAVSPGTLR